MGQVKTGETTPQKNQVVGKTSSPDIGKNPIQVKKMNFTFRENRKYDLTLGRYVYTFMARETKELPESIRNHPDWPQAEKLFIVREIGPDNKIVTKRTEENNG